MSVLVRGIDLGFGGCKFTVGRDGPTGEIRCRAFPSLAPNPIHAGNHLSGELQKRDTVIIHTNGRDYEIGFDVECAMSSTDTRCLDDNYSATSMYLALVRGALHYMAVTEIDLLVVGLPVVNIKQRARPLIKRLTGLHNVANNRTVKVHAVKVLAQPVGGFIDYAYHSGKLESMSHERNLIIDPGYFTLDWIVTEGYKITDARSGSNRGGVFSVIRTIAQTIAQQIGRPYVEYQLIERALLGKPFYIDGQPREFAPYLGASMFTIENAVTDMKNSIGRHDDIRNIVLVGGGAALYHKTVQSAFPNYEVTIANDPVFSNVRGFHVFGEQCVRRLAVA